MPATTTTADPITLVVIPTYNERENLARLVHMVLSQAARLHILIVDDSSPDGTGQIADALATQDDRIMVVHRAQRQGYASALKLGCAHALRGAYPFMLTMHADFSHNPRYIPQLIALAHTHTLAIGSRYAPGGSVIGGNLLQGGASKVFNRCAARLLALPVADCTSSLRCYQTGILADIQYDTIRFESALFGVELLGRCVHKGALTAELPIAYDNRRLLSSQRPQSVFSACGALLRLWVTLRKPLRPTEPS